MGIKIGKNKIFKLPGSTITINDTLGFVPLVTRYLKNTHIKHANCVSDLKRTEMLISLSILQERNRSFQKLTKEIGKIVDGRCRGVILRKSRYPKTRKG
jgi:hypothetical protein